MSRAIRPAPAVYEYPSVQEWEQAMKEWCDVFEDTTARVEFIAVVTGLPLGDPCWRLIGGHACWRFESPEARAEWLAAHPEVRVIPHGLKEEIVNLNDILPRRKARENQWGGTEDEYRALGLR